jgi:hypothetical protein
MNGAQGKSRPSMALPFQASPPATKQCPYCAETIHAQAVKCRHCRSSLVSGRLRGLSPWIAGLSTALGILGGLAQVLDWFGVKRGDHSPADHPFLGEGPSAGGDEVSVTIVVMAVVVGLAGCGGALLLRRNPALGATVLIAAGIAGFATTVVAGANLWLVILSGLLIGVGIVSLVIVARRLSDAPKLT